MSQTNKPDNVLRQVAVQIEQISNNREQSNVAASTAMLAGLVLIDTPPTEVRRILSSASALTPTESPP
ncbi:MAG: hypothetical protein WBB28_12915 [Crinalium sp.]